MTPLGRKWYAVGGSAESARLLGLRSDRLKIGAFAAGGLLAGLAALLQLSASVAATSSIGAGFLFSAIAAVFLGAVAFRIGTFNVAGTLTAIFALAVSITGIGIVTEDRHGNGSFAELTLGENITVTNLRRFFRKGWLHGSAEAAEVEGLVTDFNVQPPNGRRRFSSFSGGNQQKAILAKWMRMQPQVLICDQPDIGVDIGSKNAIYAALRDAAAKGAAVIVISNQHDDLEAICDRVLVMRAGRIVAELAGADATEHQISLASIGSQAQMEGLIQ